MAKILQFQVLTAPAFFDIIEGITRKQQTTDFKESEEKNGHNYRRRNYI